MEETGLGARCRPASKVSPATLGLGRVTICSAKFALFLWLLALFLLGGCPALSAAQGTSIRSYKV
jgi:hypothetical protein